MTRAAVTIGGGSANRQNSQGFHAISTLPIVARAAVPAERCAGVLARAPLVIPLAPLFSRSFYECLAWNPGHFCVVPAHINAATSAPSEELRDSSHAPDAHAGVTAAEGARRFRIDGEFRGSRLHHEQESLYRTFPAS